MTACWRIATIPALLAKLWSASPNLYRWPPVRGITHAIERPESKFIEAVSGGWPRIISNLKSLLETGSVVLPPKAA